MPSGPSTSFQFGSFELRIKTRELFKKGIRLKLRPQPFHVLQLLVERAGDVVSREELRERLWSKETYVDFEHGLNTAIKELRAVLGDSASDPQFIQTIPRLGYRLMVDVTMSAPQPSPSGDSGSHAIASGPAGAPPEIAIPAASPSISLPSVISITIPPPAASADRARSTSRHWWLSAAALLAAVAFASLGVRAWRASHVDHSRQMLAVLPFENLTGDPAQDYFSDGLTEEMIAQLGRIDPKHLGVIARTSVMRYKQNRESTAAIARELGVGYVLEGTVRRDGGKVRVSAELIQAKDQTDMWSHQFDRELDDLLALQSEIAHEIAGEISVQLNDNHALVAHADLRSPSSYVAYDLYLRGLYFWNQRSPEGLRRSIDYFQQAIQKDPGSARAYAALADSETLISGFAGLPPGGHLEKARAAAHRAVELDDSLAEAHVAMALVAQDCDWDWKTAETEYRRAIDLNPNLATAHHWYAEYLSLMGRFDEARAEIERARQLDPLSLIIATDNGVILYYARQFDPAIQQLSSVEDMQPHFPRSDTLLFAYVAEGRTLDVDKSLTAWEGATVGPWYWGSYAYLMGRIGNAKAAREGLRQLDLLNRQQTVDALAFSRAYLALNQKDLALAEIERALAQHSVSLTNLNVDPLYDPLRDEPRFQAALRQMHFPQ